MGKIKKIYILLVTHIGLLCLLILIPYGHNHRTIPVDNSPLLSMTLNQTSPLEDWSKTTLQTLWRYTFDLRDLACGSSM